MNADLQSFVRDALARGMGRDAIRQTLQQAGWRPEEIASALLEAPPAAGEKR